MKPTPSAIEAAARSICQADERNGGPPWDLRVANKHSKDSLFDEAEAALSGPLGDMVLVPREATDEMLKAALRVTRNEPYGPADDCIGGAVYRAMIAAAGQSGWLTPFKPGDRVTHTSRDENGTVTAIEDGCVVIEFDTTTPRGDKAIGRYDDAWFRMYPCAMIAAVQED